MLCRRVRRAAEARSRLGESRSRLPVWRERLGGVHGAPGRAPQGHRRRSRPHLPFPFSAAGRREGPRRCERRCQPARPGEGRAGNQRGEHRGLPRRCGSTPMPPPPPPRDVVVPCGSRRGKGRQRWWRAVRVRGLPRRRGPAGLGVEGDPAPGPAASGSPRA